MFPGVSAAVEEIRDAGDTKKWGPMNHKGRKAIFRNLELRGWGQRCGRFSNRKLPVSSDPENGHFVMTWL